MYGGWGGEITLVNLFINRVLMSIMAYRCHIFQIFNPPQKRNSNGKISANYYGVSRQKSLYFGRFLKYLEAHK